ncbi:MAG: hypothetical protein CR980_00525 [Propionibacteriales bacterium]|nr:MAG: hypothetical protein CR980_00525 [Propionibacteriales bacterium]
MPRRRDRHQRGLRGPLALRNPLTGTVLLANRRQTGSAWFQQCVTDCLKQIADSAPEALAGVDVGLEEAPSLEAQWTGDDVPLAAALEHRGSVQVILYRRPLERRADSRAALRNLVRKVLVEQLSSISGLPVEQIDPGFVD